MHQFLIDALPFAAWFTAGFSLLCFLGVIYYSRETNKHLRRARAILSSPQK
jgi:cbb3-type cytochrome oxidase subunit 3